MKPFHSSLPYLLPLLLCTACGYSKWPDPYGSPPQDSATASGASSLSALAGTWVSTTNGNVDQLTIGSDGSAASTYCASRATISQFVPGDDCSNGATSCGTATVTTTATNGAATCAALGAMSCSYGVSSSQLTIDCGSSLTYQQETSVSLSAAGVAGTWSDAGNGDQLTINSSGSYTSSYCSAAGSISNLFVSTGCAAGETSCGTVSIDTKSTNGASGCLPAGNQVCYYSTSATGLTYTCGAVTNTYSN